MVYICLIEDSECGHGGYGVKGFCFRTPLAGYSSVILYSWLETLFRKLSYVA